MKRDSKSNNTNRKETQLFAQVLLDAEGTLYTFHNDLPIYLEGEGLRKIGIAQLHKKRKKLYGDLVLENDPKYSKLFAHLLHDVYGYVFAILLSSNAFPDSLLPCLEDRDASH